jgi:hypothetical protein
MRKTSFLVLAKFILSGFLLANFYSCGKGFSDDNKLQEEIWQGQYGTQFKPLNQKLGTSSGWAKISIYENQIWARVKFHGNKTKDMHAQYIHLNGRCPTMKDDKNGDGYLDFMEVYDVAGPIILPLDSNLNSQLKGIFEFPFMKRRPFYYYSEASNYGRTMRDLRSEDVVVDDMMTKLHGEDLDLHRRVILIYGVDIDVFLPNTVRTFTGYPSQATLPVACGELEIDDHRPYEDY